ncbi:MAG: helix-turn-helix domain-containing protein [Planctomycetes bacterium]|nr:helix-turn-helix domain-containing protein [Planctomycetota bacterium]
MTSRLLKSREAAKYLCVSEKTLWNLTNAGEIIVVRMGRLIRYDPADLDKFIEKSKTEIS